jgi:hypothetical protein
MCWFVTIDVLSGAIGTCCDVAVAQINYTSLKHNTQDIIKTSKGSLEEGSSQIFMLDDMQFWGVWRLSRLEQKKTENYQAKLITFWILHPKMPLKHKTKNVKAFYI